MRTREGIDASRIVVHGLARDRARGDAVREASNGEDWGTARAATVVACELQRV